MKAPFINPAMMSFSQRVFDEIGVSVDDLEDYVEKMDDRAFKVAGKPVSEVEIPAFPAPSTSDLNFLSVTR